MDTENIFFTLFMLCCFSFSYHGYTIFKNFITVVLQNMNSDNSDNNNNIPVISNILDLKPPPKYEDKYLEEFRNLPDEFVCDEEELILKAQKYNEFLNEFSGDADKAEEKANKFIFEHRLEKLTNCYVMEYTPLGNVIMIYDKERETFKFYSDTTIPYRYLEVVGRKYAKQFGCKQIFIDMEEELKISEEKKEREQMEKEEKKEESIKNQIPNEQKKNVFAKFKSYNKEAGTGHVNIAPPPKNSIPNKLQENERSVLKERSNRYTYEGKFANFSFIKKIDRKTVDKKYAMSFADFKKNFLVKSKK